MKNKTRREVLLRSGVAIGGMAASRLLGQTPAPESDMRGSAEESREMPKKSPRLRGLMVDAGRVPESLAYYRRVIDFCSDWEFNALQLRLADDQGCALRF